MGSDSLAVLGVPFEILQRLDVVWTFILLTIRFSSMFLILPGIGSIAKLGTMKVPAVLVMAMTATLASPAATIPANWGLLASQATSEVLLGFGLGFIPFLIVAGVQTGCQVASTTMGLGMGNIVDPTTGQQTSDIALIVGDLVIVTFLLLGGHHAVIYAAAGLGGQLVPGTFLVTESSIDLLVDETALIFKIGLLISAPVLVAMLLTNFVMGLISKAVPTVNIFIISFPLSIGIGLVLFYFAIPDILLFIQQQFAIVEDQILMLLRDATLHMK